MADLKLTDITGIGAVTAKKLIQRGLKTVQDVVEADVATIGSATGFPTGRSEAIQKAAGLLMKQNASDQLTIAPEPDIEMESTKDGKKKKKGKKEKDGKKKNKKEKDGKKKGKKEKDGKKKKK